MNSSVTPLTPVEVEQRRLIATDATFSGFDVRCGDCPAHHQPSPLLRASCCRDDAPRSGWRRLLRGLG